MIDDFAAFARLVDALRPWLPQLVVVGGWAHRLHRLHPFASPPHYLPVRTRDADLAFAKASALRGDVRAALKNAGFNEERFGDDAPPVKHYRLAEVAVPTWPGGGRRRGRPGPESVGGRTVWVCVMVVGPVSGREPPRRTPTGR